ncbi:hypothetical protein [Clostridium vincentii]|uniref:TATA-box binding protein n=1 Tax=Clostridium vincentii TaxID=52704 RepID=A0A2T0BGZ1_9CLOT|nr:hypothetical protein [Clostridium vincentii]PRR83144.1 hypothetical protein CLVI_11860 [Clostridium vincentii]
MKYKICLILVFLFSFSTIEAVPKEKVATEIEGQVREISSFVENGVKVEYKTSTDDELVLKELKHNISKSFPEKNITCDEEQITGADNSMDIQANIYVEDNNTIVEIKIINYNKEITISDLMKDLSQLKSKNSDGIKYFQYIKGKINYKDKILETINNRLAMENISTLDAYNGYVGTANLYDGEKVNFAISCYDTGSYLIMGTPIIFATY